MRTGELPIGAADGTYPKTALRGGVALPHTGEAGLLFGADLEAHL